MKNNIKRNTWIWITIGLLFAIVAYYLITNTIHTNTMSSKICIEKICFAVEIARTKQEQEKGLMYRMSMPEKEGMVFVFPQSDVYNFRMKNTRIPLDIVRIDDHYTVVRVITAQPCTKDPCPVYKPQKIGQYVLEINAGIASKYGVQEGTVMNFQNIK